MNCPMKGITNFSNYNWSYIHSVLQSLSCLESSKELVASNINNPLLIQPNFAMSNSFINILNTLLCGMEGNSANIIENYKNSYFKNSQLINNKNPLLSDPYHFLDYCLEFLHLENNMPLNPYYNIQNFYNQPIQKQKDDNYMYCLFLGFFQQTQNSCITKYFLNVEKYVYDCHNCGRTFSYGLNKIIMINVDAVRFYRDLTFPAKAGSKICFDDCFKCYCGANTYPCRFCGNSNGFRSIRICCSAKILMIYLDRNSHSFKNDIEISNFINISNYYSQTRSIGLNYNPYYSLKACISYCNTGKYFADCYIKSNNSFANGWYRFMDNKVKYLSNPLSEINEYEPQLLIYELNDSFFFSQNFLFNTTFRTNNNMDIFNRLIQNFFIKNTILANYFFLLKFQPMNQTVDNAQIQNGNIMKFAFSNIMQPNQISINKYNNPINNQINNFQLRFSIVPETGDQTFETNMKIFAQVRSNFTVEQAINNFFLKALKKREAIKKFLLNNKVLDQKSQQTLESLNIDENTIIKAVKAANFDNLNITK